MHAREREVHGPKDDSALAVAQIGTLEVRGRVASGGVRGACTPLVVFCLDMGLGTQCCA